MIIKFKKEKINNLCANLGIARLQDMLKVGVGANAFRKKDSNNFSAETLALWLRKGELDALNLRITDFNKSKLESSLVKIRRLNLKPFNEIKDELKKILMDCGVILCYTPKLTNVCVNGASRWYNNNNILIQISDLGKKEDVFWFTLFHELGHALKHLYKKRKINFIDLESNEKNDFEIEADSFAKDALVPNDLYQTFIKNDFDEIKIINFSKKIEADPGVLVGRLCNDKLMEFSQASKFRKKLKF